MSSIIQNNHHVTVSSTQVPKHLVYQLKRFFVYYKRVPIDGISPANLCFTFFHIDAQKQKGNDQDGGHHGDIAQC